MKHVLAELLFTAAMVRMTYSLFKIFNPFDRN